MITRELFLATQPLVEGLLSKGISIAPKPNSLLSDLVSNSDSFGVSPEVADLTDALSYHMEQNTSSPDNLYNQIFYNSIDDLKNVVLGHISIAKNDVKPIVTQFAKGVQEFLEKYKVVDPNCSLEILCLDVSPILQEQSLLNDLKKYKGRSIEVPKNFIRFSPKTEEELIPMIMVGDKDMDRSTLEWLSNKPEGFLVAIWNNYFVMSEKYVFDNLKNEDIFSKADISLVIYLLSLNLFNNPDSSLKDISLRNYESSIADIRSFAGSVLINSINMIEMSNNSDTLVIENNYYKKCIKVNGYVYRKWLSEGGDNTVLLGLLISKVNIKNLNLLTESSEKLKNQWNQYCSLYKINENDKLLERFKSYLTNAFIFSLANKSNIELEYISKNSSCIETMKKLSEEVIESIKLPDLTDPYKISLDLIGKCRFFYTSSYEILREINEAGIINPDLQPRDAATISVINYILDFFIEQMSISKQ